MYVACSAHGEKRNTHKMSVGKYEGKSPLGRPKCKWADNIKIKLKEIMSKSVDYNKQIYSLHATAMTVP
jgi:hypothetical protein